MASLGARSCADAQPKDPGADDPADDEMRSRTAGGATAGGRRGDGDLPERGGGNKGISRLGESISARERNGEHGLSDLVGYLPERARNSHFNPRLAWPTECLPRDDPEILNTGENTSTRLVSVALV